MDSRRFHDPLEGLAKGLHVNPTIEVRDRPVNTSLLHARLESLERIAIRPFHPPSIGLDGAFCGIEGDEFRNVRLEWWCDGPKNWQPLTRWAAETQEWLDSIAATELTDK